MHHPAPPLLARNTAQDRYYLDQWGSCASTDPIVYVLTLGVLPGWQKLGVASALLRLVSQYAAEQLRCAEGQREDGSAG